MYSLVIGQDNIVLDYSNNLQVLDNETIEVSPYKRYAKSAYEKIVQVDSLPEDYQDGKYKYDVVTGFVLNTLWVDPSQFIPVDPAAIRMELENLRDSLKSADQKYRELDLSTAALADVKTAKINQLNELSGKAIIAGFNSDVNGVSYHFSCSVEAQANFTGTQYKFDKGEITTVGWTAFNNTTGKIERIELDAVAFKSVADMVFPHINSNVSRFRDDLEPQVEAATTNAEVDAIVW